MCNVEHSAQRVCDCAVLLCNVEHSAQRVCDCAVLMCNVEHSAQRVCDCAVLLCNVEHSAQRKCLCSKKSYFAAKICALDFDIQHTTQIFTNVHAALHAISHTHTPCVFIGY